MSRNYEKNFGRLNRLWLEKGEGKRENRPKLSTLKTASEISAWLPSIKNELDFFLKQTEVPCYSENKINECRKRISHLETEYKSFVRKLHQLNSNLKATPWTARAYEKKERGDTCSLTLHPIDVGAQLQEVNLLETPVLLHDHLYQDKWGETIPAECSSTIEETYPKHHDVELFPKVSRNDQSVTASTSEEIVEKGNSETEHWPQSSETARKKQNVLGLDYSSSEGEA